MAWFQLFAYALNRSGILPLPHTIDILSYNSDANVDTTCYTVRRFTVAAYGVQRNSLDCTHPAVNLKS